MRMSHPSGQMRHQAILIMVLAITARAGIVIEIAIEIAKPTHVDDNTFITLDGLNSQLTRLNLTNFTTLNYSVYRNVSLLVTCINADCVPCNCSAPPWAPLGGGITFTALV